MARLGDLIKSQREKYNLSAKQLAKRCGVTEAFVLEIESGKRIPNDIIATRMLKAMGSEDPLADMSLDTVADSTQSRGARAPVGAPKPREAKPQKAAQAPVSDAWKDALSGSGLVRQVPVYDMAGATAGARMMATEQGAIMGEPADKVFYLRLDNDQLRFYRMMAGDYLLCAPHPGLIDGAVMVFTLNGKRMARLLRKMESDKVDMLWYDAGEKRESAKLSDISSFAKILRVEFTP